MADKYDKNGYNSSDFKRNSSQNVQGESGEHAQDGDENSNINEKAGEYMRELLSEKIKLNNAKFPISSKLVDQEVAKVQTLGRIPPRDSKYMDVFHEKPVKVVVKVLVPVKEHPKFNFVGKLLGPKGNTMKHLQEETLCKMAVLGRGSMRDRQKEEELRNSLDPKYSHLTDELHVEISALAPPAEAHARIAYALAEVKKYLLPDTNDMIRQTQMRDIMERDGTAKRQPLLADPGQRNVMYNACTVTKRSFTYGDPIVNQGPRVGGPGHMPPAPRAMPGKAKIINILDRARSAMDTQYSYDDPYAVQEPPVRGSSVGGGGDDYYYERGQDRYYEDDYYKEEGREYKTSARDVGTRRPYHGGPHGHAPRGHAPHGHAPHGHARAPPYQRPGPNKIPSKKPRMP